MGGLWSKVLKGQASGFVEDRIRLALMLVQTKDQFVCSARINIKRYYTEIQWKLNYHSSSATVMINVYYIGV